MLTERQDNLFKELVENYVSSAQPQGSSSLAKKFSISSATVRNEMCELEECGYIYQPHTSAGRIPTENGYKYYLENYIDKEKDLPSKWQKALEDIIKKSEGDSSIKIKSLAKVVAEISQNAVLVGFSPFDFYYTGLANLFSQPEFSQSCMVVSVAEVVDHLDDIMNDIFFKIEKQVILIGDENPFDRSCASIVTKFKYNNVEGVVGLLGPQRMNYQRNFSLLNSFNKLTVKL